MDRAEAVMERTALKVQKSKGHAKVIHSRKKTWDEVNREAFERAEQAKLSIKAKAKMEGDAEVAAFYAEDDNDAEMGGAEDTGNAASPVQAASIPAPATDEEEEIL